MTDGPFFPDDDKKDGDGEEPESEATEAEAGEAAAEEDVEAEDDELEGPAEPLILGDNDFGMPEIDPAERPFFDDEEDTKEGIAWKPIAAVVAGLVIGVGGWYMISGKSDDRPPRTISAPKSPVKERPADPGGMAIPYQDALVYNEVAGDAEPQPETLGPGAEEPLDVPLDESVEIEKPVVTLPVEDEPAPAADVQVASSDTPVDIPKVAGSDWVGGYLVQLGAFTTVEIATTAWRKLYDANRDIFTDPDANVLPKKIGSGKEVFALRAGPYGSHADAGEVCKLLKTREVDCFVVKPE